ncbi:ATP-binding protein [Pontivivens ytuae]|uniref:histidine kinase n=1 Tax=Pontivivens ytuae TaxID=2789856 RepID=A0A7S9QCY2_9RHOB|nr:ATP-binding protein [Pontivivens ytuae]QPH54413.1 sensor N-terminal transmembrane domain-containing protein [Pontivivens ytuae]
MNKPTRPEEGAGRRLSLPKLERGGGLTVPVADVPDAAEVKLYRTSPIARRIVFFNLVAQATLVIGILFLSRFESSLIEERQSALIREAAIVARTLDQFAAAEEGPGLDREVARATLLDFGDMVDARMRLFDTGVRLIGDTGAVAPDEIVEPPIAEETEGEAPAPETVVEEVPRQASRLFDTAIARMAQLIRQVEGDVQVLTAQDIRRLAEAGLAGQAQAVITRDRTGDYIMSVTLPVGPVEQPAGALLLSTRGGDIEELVSAERRQLMTVFLLALTVSIALSIVLARSIARPLRVLASAAEKASGSTRDMAPERIHFPDLTARPDEIGYLSRALILMTQALYERIEANEAFAADVAHEIKNPLTSLKSAVDTMHYAKTDEQRQRLMDVIASDVQRLDRLVTDISNASRLDSELVREEMEPFDLGQLVTSLVEYNQGQAEDRGATLVAETPERPIRVQGLEGRLAQVFVNLITNALSFTPEGGRVTAKVFEEGGKAVVTVEDTGPGIPPDNLQDVFSRFYSERPGQEFGNHSGLGLAISKQIVEAHQGTIKAGNVLAEDGETRLGARFTVRLPI